MFTVVCCYKLLHTHTHIDEGLCLYFKNYLPFYFYYVVFIFCYSFFFGFLFIKLFIRVLNYYRADVEISSCKKVDPDFWVFFHLACFACLRCYPSISLSHVFSDLPPEQRDIVWGLGRGERQLARVDLKKWVSQLGRGLLPFVLKHFAFLRRFAKSTMTTSTGSVTVTSLWGIASSKSERNNIHFRLTSPS